jgi:hypothetical protein
MFSSLQVSWSQFCTLFLSLPCMLHLRPLAFKTLWNLIRKVYTKRSPSVAVLVISCSVLFYLTTLCRCLSVGLNISCLDSFHGSLYLYLLYCDTMPQGRHSRAREYVRC